MTAPRFAWVFNLDAEFELARPRYTTPIRLRAHLQEHGQGAKALMGPHDVLAAPGLTDAGRRIGRAWCPTPFALAALHAAGVTPESHPAVDVLRQVNHRRFACELGGGLPGQRYVESEKALSAVLQRPPPSDARGWLLKRPLAFAGRGQLRVQGPLDPAQQSWVVASLSQDGLVVEPLVSPLLEVSLHGFIRRDGRWSLGNVCVQTVSPKGVFRDVARAPAGALQGSEAAALHAQAARVARALVKAGYFGPFGVDAYRHQGGFCALSEINARYTLGFAVGFPQPAHTLTLGD